MNGQQNNRKQDLSPIKTTTKLNNESNNRKSTTTAKLSPERMLKLFEQINIVCSKKQINLLAEIYNLVKPLSFIDSTNNLFKFDLFSLEPNVIEKLEDLLLNTYNTYNESTTTTTTTTSNTNNLINNNKNSKTVNLTNTSIPKGAILTTNKSSTTNSMYNKSNNNMTTSSSNLNKSNSSNKSFNNNNNNNNNNKTKELKTNIIK